MGELCDSGRAMWQWASCVAVDKGCGSGLALYRWHRWRAIYRWRGVWQWASCAAAGKLWVFGQAWLGLASDPVFGAGVPVAHLTCGLPLSHRVVDEAMIACHKGYRAPLSS